MTDKQQEVINYLKTVNYANLEQIYQNVRFSYYCNWSGNLSKFMANMVNRGFVERLGKGTFKLLRSTSNEKHFSQDERQLNLFKAEK